MSTFIRSNLKLIRIAALVLVLVIVAWACIRLLSDSSTQTTNDAYVQADFTLVAPRIAGQIFEQPIAKPQFKRGKIAGDLFGLHAQIAGAARDAAGRHHLREYVQLAQGGGGHAP